jgi:hypothetical protein
MSDNVLKREFSRKDVNRMRNIITGKTGDKTQTMAGWEKKVEDHQEGDIWEEGGRTWTIKGGIKQTVTKLDPIKKMAIMPLCCPKCKNPMKLDNLNKKMYSIHGNCFDCTIEMEQELRRQGKFQEYERLQQTANKDSLLSDIETVIDSWYAEKDSYVTEAGDVESWEGGDKKEIYNKIKEGLAKAKEQDIYN